MSLVESCALQVDVAKARELHRAYREARMPRTTDDVAIMAAYREIARGRTIVQAAESIRAAGRDESGLPKLAITRANERRVHCRAGDNRVVFSASNDRGSSISRASP